MVRHALSVLFLLAMAAAPLFAQESDATAPPSNDEPAPNAKPAPEGDVITLTSGKQLLGMQVLRETAHTVVVQIMAETEPLVLSRRFVTQIDYDDHDPTVWANDRRRDMAEKPNVIVADRLSGELHKNLNTPLPEDLLESDGEDLIKLLAQLSKATKVRIDVGRAVRAIPDSKRQWRYKVKPNTSLESLLRENLLDRFEGLRVLYRFDHIMVRVSDAKAPSEKAAD